jgi:hypothetical protein
MFLTKAEQKILSTLKSYDGKLLWDLFASTNPIQDVTIQSEHGLNGKVYQKGEIIKCYKSPKDSLRFLDILAELIAKLNAEHLIQTFRDAEFVIPIEANYELGDRIQYYGKLQERLDFTKLQLFITDGFDPFFTSNYLTEKERNEKTERAALVEERKDAKGVLRYTKWAIFVGAAINVAAVTATILFNLYQSNKPQSFSITSFPKSDSLNINFNRKEFDSIINSIKDKSLPIPASGAYKK